MSRHSFEKMVDFDRRSLLAPKSLLRCFGFTAVPLFATSTALTIFDADTLHRAAIPFSRLTIAAACLDMISLAFLVGVIVIRSRRYSSSSPPSGHKWLRLGLSILNAFITAAAICLTLTELVSKALNPDDISRVRPRTSNRFLVAEFVVWGFAVVLTCIFYCIVIFTRPGEAQVELPVVSELQDPTPVEREITPPVSMSIMSRPYTSYDHRPPSPTISNDSRESLGSFRSSLYSVHQVVRPITSRTKLVKQRSSLNKEARLSQVDSIMDGSAQADGFDTWDTSSVDPQTRDTVMQAAPTRGRTLEPIPGSRPVSPADALDGPFPEVSERPETSDSQQTRRPTTAVSSTSYIRGSSRPTSPSGDESHIHPLFRSDSPAPPPTSHGTSIVASPYSGQSLPARSFSRARSGSRPASRSRCEGESPSLSSPPLLKAKSLDEGAMRRMTPPDRETTPPIPDFILTANNEIKKFS